MNNELYSYPGFYFQRPKKLSFRQLAVHIGLFVLTAFSTFLVGLGDGIAGALWYSGGLMAILLAHELGHFFTARKYGISVTLPYFIPMPISPFGTLGAVIKMDRYIPNRKVLFDVGVAGPLAGFFFIIPALVLGLSWSKVVPFEATREGAISLGESILFKLFVRISIGHVPEGQDVLLHPLAFAGWVGLFVTALNLLPVGQLDGGHILYALFHRKSKTISRIFYWILLGICIFFYLGWFLMIILLALIRSHPPTLDDTVALDSKRRALGWIVLFLFLISFTPVPFIMGEKGLLSIFLRAFQR